MNSNKNNLNKKTTTDDSSSVIYIPDPKNKSLIKAKIFNDQAFEEMIESLMSSELVYGDNNYY